MILDTNFLIALDAQDKSAQQLAVELEAAAIPLRVPTAVLFELYISVGAGEDAVGNVRNYEALLANKPTVELTPNIARRAGVLEGLHLQSDGKPALGPVDAIVAATGRVYNEAVVSDDGDFESVEELTVESW